MKETGIITLKWVYSPTNFFETRMVDVISGFDHVIDKGKIAISMALDEYNNSPDIQKTLNNRLTSIFLGAILTSQKPFELTYIGRETAFQDGKREYILEAASGIYTMTLGTINGVVIGPNGEIKGDTKAESVKKQRLFADLSVKYRDTDSIVDSILASFEKSLIYPEAALVHLYEIRDALARKFSGGDTAKRELGISNKPWNRLGYLADVEPLNQGRHSGKHIGQLRDASEGEIEEARNIAIMMVEAYFFYLETHPKTSS